MSSLPPLQIRQRTAKDGRVYSVQLADQWLASGKHPDIYWFFTWPTNPKREHRATGVRLDEYLITVDTDPRWRALVTLAGETILKWDDEKGQEQSTDARLWISRVNIQLGSQKSTALPLEQILSACVQVGMVAGTAYPDSTIKAVITDTGQFISPADLDELLGVSERRPAKEQHETALRAAIEYNTMKAEGTVAFNSELQKNHTIESWVSLVTGISDGKKLLSDARKDPDLKEISEQSRQRKAKK